MTVCVCVFMVLADREVQRILLELLNQMDGFDQTVNVKVSHLRFAICHRCRQFSALNWQTGWEECLHCGLFTVKLDV